MTWAALFQSRSFRYGSLCGCGGLAVGAGGSAAMAMKIASFCSTGVSYIVSEMGKDIAISELNATINFGSYNTSITIKDINAALPEGWLNIINHASDLPPYCFLVPFLVGLGIAAATSLALASTVAIAIYISEQNGGSTGPIRRAGSDGSFMLTAPSPPFRIN